MGTLNNIIYLTFYDDIDENVSIPHVIDNKRVDIKSNNRSLFYSPIPNPNPL